MGRKKKSPPPSFATAGTWHTHYVVLFDDLLNSPAYIALSAAAKEAYTILMQEYKGMTVLTSKYRLSIYFGSAPATSASPPVFKNGTTSEAANKIFFMFQPFSLS